MWNILLGTIFAATTAYFLNSASCNASTSTSSTSTFSQTLSATTEDLSIAARLFINIVGQDQLLASEARSLEASRLALWQDYPFAREGKGKGNGNSNVNCRLFEDSFHSLYSQLNNDISSLPFDLLSLISSHKTDVYHLDKGIGIYLIKQLVYNSSLVRFFASTNCRPSILQLLPPLLPSHLLSSLQCQASAELLETYLSVLDQNSQRLQALNATFTSLSSQQDLVETHMRNLISLQPPIDNLVLSFSGHTVRYIESTIDWIALGEKFREKILAWNSFSKRAYAVPLRQFGPPVIKLLDHYGTDRDRLLRLQKWDIWGVYSREKWMRIAYIREMILKLIREVEEARRKVEESRICAARCDARLKSDVEKETQQGEGSISTTDESEQHKYQHQRISMGIENAGLGLRKQWQIVVDRRNQIKELNQIFNEFSDSWEDAEFFWQVKFGGSRTSSYDCEHDAEYEHDPRFALADCLHTLSSPLQTCTSLLPQIPGSVAGLPINIRGVISQTRAHLAYLDSCRSHNVKELVRDYIAGTNNILHYLDQVMSIVNQTIHGDGEAKRCIVNISKRFRRVETWLDGLLQKRIQPRRFLQSRPVRTPEEQEQWMEIQRAKNISSISIVTLQELFWALQEIEGSLKSWQMELEQGVRGKRARWSVEAHLEALETSLGTEGK